MHQKAFSHHHDFREAARESWLKSDGSIETAAIAFQADSRIAKLDPMTIIALLQIAMKLWAWWRSMKISEPSVVACSDELAFLGDDE